MTQQKIIRSTQPQSAVGIDWGNPITRGLKLVVTPNSNYGTLGPGNVTLASNAKGVANQYISPGFRIQKEMAPFSSNEVTVFAIVDFNSPGELYDTIGGVRNLSGTNRVHIARAQFPNTYFGGDLHPYNYDYRTATIIPLGVPTSCAVTVTNTFVKFYTEGELVSTGINNSPQVNSYSQYELFNKLSGDDASNGDKINIFAVWDRALSAVELAELEANPWQIFAPISKPIFINSYYPELQEANVNLIGVSASYAVGSVNASSGTNVDIDSILSTSSQGSIGAQANTSGFKHWRINISATDTVDQYFASINEIELKSSIGGADLATGGVATASSITEAGREASLAFDDSLGSLWATTATGLPVAPGPDWIAYELTSPANISHITIRAASGTAQRPLRAPKTFTIEYSADGVTWFVSRTVTNEPTWTADELRTFETTVSGDVSTSLVGLSASSSVGSLTLAGDANTSIIGTQSASNIGTLATNTAVSTILSGVSSTGNIGTLSTSTAVNAQIVGISGTTNVGNLSAQVSVSTTLNGVQSSSAIGNLSVTGAAVATLTGVNANSSIGVIQGTGSGVGVANILGVSSTNQVGSVNASGTRNAETVLSGILSSGSTGTLTATVSVSTLLNGVLSSTTLGGVSALGTRSASTTILGVEAGTSFGSITAYTNVSIQLNGIEVANYVGELQAVGTSTNTNASIVLPNILVSSSVGNITASGTLPYTISLRYYLPETRDNIFIPASRDNITETEMSTNNVVVPQSRTNILVPLSRNLTFTSPKRDT